MNFPAKIALSILVLALACAHADAQDVMTRRPLMMNQRPEPANAQILAAKFRPHLTLQAAQWMPGEVQRLSSGKISPDDVMGDVQSACSQASTCFDLANMPIEDAMLLMMMLIDNDAEQDMRDQLAAMQREQQQKQALRAAHQKMQEQQQSMRQQMQNEYNSKDSTGDISQEQQLKMQMLMDRMQQALAAASSAQKKFEETEDTITKNFK